MSSGSLQHVVICVPKSPQSGGSVNPCADVDGVFMQPVMTQAYLLDPSASTLIDSATAPFDYSVAGSIWGMAFAFVVGLYLASSQVGLLLNLIRGR